MLDPSTDPASRPDGVAVDLHLLGPFGADGDLGGGVMIDKGVAPPLHEFEVRYGSRESKAPSEIVVPPVQYANGFYVWLSDGRAYFDAKTHTLYHYPSADDPGTEHWLRIRPPLPNADGADWQYFFDGKGGELAR